MMYFTYDQFKKFLSLEDDLKYRTIYEILYYCGLRRGELRGLTWKNIDFNNKTLSIKKQIRLHDFRHSCASLLINSGANVTVVAKYLGHTKIEETLNTYTHLFSTALNEVVNVIDNLEQ